jgi:hypothetical protein
MGRTGLDQFLIFTFSAAAFLVVVAVALILPW